ncbi:hypothetical protein AN641_08030 [Candidatus Epulonipiscioides gigas]|nr:hypothetical protein AN641_08030 [Epulopiscium sp. SCG-C07WGA-EpuloA2]
MIRINEISLKLDESEEILIEKVAKYFRMKEKDILDFKIIKKSIDARKSEIKFVYSIDLSTTKDEQLLKTKKVIPSDIFPYQYPVKGKKKLGARPVIIGAGPCGLFAALILAQMDYKPIIIERGNKIEDRIKNVEDFWHNRILNINSNVQFGEGGAGTFSDGKLTTQIKNPRCRKVLEEFINFGASEEILYKNKPHVGTDLIRQVIVNMRKEIENLGGTFYFNSQLTNLKITEGHLTAIEVNNNKEISTNICVLALGHSARDTFKMLADTSIHIEQKPFAIGVRIEHLQEWINKAQYGDFHSHANLSAAEYKLSCKSDNKNVYSFCMCPGGYVVGASSQENTVVTNGMSYYSRNGKNANSAILVNVTCEDFNSSDVLAGIYLQEKLEKLAFNLGGNNYNAPIQRVEDFLSNKETTKLGIIAPTYKPGFTMTNLRKHMPKYIADAIAFAIIEFNKKIENFAHKDAIITGFETRSSSPIKILRNENFESNIKGVYPAGEGAGYAGGIMSSAVDGIQIAEKIVSEFLL